MNTNRQLWVDIAKGIAIVAVVLGHIEYNYPQHRLMPLSDMLSEFWHVPVFFLIGGFFIKEERLLKPFSFIKSKVKSLYLLLLYIYIPVIFLHNFFIDVGFYDLAIDYSGKYVSRFEGSGFLVEIMKAVFFAGREPILGAMWFVYVLFASLCLLSLLSCSLRRVINDDRRYEVARCLTFLVMAVLSCIFTNVMDVTIPRCNNVFTALWLLYVGMLINQRYKVEYDNAIIVVVCAVLAYHLMIINPGSVALNSNKYHDVVTLTVSSVACLYMICFVSKKIQLLSIGRLLGFIGQESFYVMGLQFIGFKVCTLLINMMGGSANLAQLKAHAGSSLLLLLMYLLFGVFIPIVIVAFVRYMKSMVLKRIYIRS